jgi:hypothetical protein
MVRYTYPRPLALAWRDGESASEAGERLKVWLRLAEACAAYAAAMRLSELDTQGQLLGSETFRLFVASLRKGGLTFGAWTSILKAKGKQQQSASPLGIDLTTVAADPGFLAALDQARALRNAADHHRLEHAELEKVAERAKSLVFAALRGMEPLVTAELVEVERASNDPKGSRCLTYRARVWSGDAPIGEPEEGSAERRLESGALYLRCLDGTWIMPSPFLVAAPSRMGEICVPDHLDGNGDLQFRPLAGAGEVANEVAARHYQVLLRSSTAGRTS